MGYIAVGIYYRCRAIQLWNTELSGYTAVGINTEVLEHRAVGLYSCGNIELWGYTAVGTYNCGAIQLWEHRTGGYTAAGT